MKHTANKFVDLQTHTIFSDGYKTPTELVALLKSYNIKVAALTDHFTMRGIPEFKRAAKKAGIKPIAGIELYVIYRGFKLHMLGYNINEKNKFIHNAIHAVHVKKNKLLREITPKLAKKGIIIDPDELIKGKAGYIGMNNLYRHLYKNPDNINNIKKALGKDRYENWEIYMKYFSKKTNTYYPEIYISAKKGIEMIKKAGGVPILAHPGEQLRFEQDWVIHELVKMGLQGIECFSPHHDYAKVSHYLRIAKHNNWITTGGSDYHGDIERDLVVNRYWDYSLLPYRLYENIKAF